MPEFQNNLGLRFANIVEKHPQQTALFFEDGKRLTYQQLDQRSNQVARFLFNKGLGPDSHVCINLDKTAVPYCVILACLKIGATYFAIDPKSPFKRVEYIFNQCPPDIVFSGHDLPVESLKDKVIFCPETFDRLDFCDGLKDSALSLDYVVRPSNPAYIMFTSGSTGVPKGAVMTHANVCLFIDWIIKEYNFVPEDIHTHLNPIYFDNSVFDMYSTFFSGGTLVPFKTALLQDPDGIIRRIEQSKCTTFFAVPSMFLFLQTTKTIDAKLMRSLKRIIFGGEGYPKARLKELFDQLGKQTQLINVYGPTECTCMCSSYNISAADFENLEGYPPIGGIAGHFTYYLLDGEKEVQPGDIGELCLGGSCVGLGYYNHPELTKKSFVQNPLSRTSEEKIYRTGDLMRFNPEDGKLWFVGRKDFQIKHQGHRIELEEIQHAVATIDGVEEAIALHMIDDGISQIIGIVSSKKNLDASKLRNQVAQLLPRYMVPNKIHVIDHMPKNANGKTDRQKLRELYIVSALEVK